MIAETLRREMRPLRRELADYKEQRDLHSILGSLGYIRGIFGLAFFIACKARRRED